MSLLDPSVWVAALISAMTLVAPAPSVQRAGIPVTQLGEHLVRFTPGLTDRGRVERLVNDYYREYKPECEVQRFDWTYERRVGRYLVATAKVHSRYESRLLPMGAVMVLVEFAPEGVRLLELQDQRGYEDLAAQRQFIEREERAAASSPPPGSPPAAP